MVAFHTIPFETSYIDHREEVSGCWPPRLVCGVWRDFRRIHHWCDGRAHIHSCWHASQDRVRGNVDASRLERVLLWIHSHHGVEVRHLEECPQEHLQFPRRGVADLIHSAHGWCISLSHAAPAKRACRHNRDLKTPDSFRGVLPWWHGRYNDWLASCSKIGRLASPTPIKPRLDPIVVRLWQGELWTLPDIQLWHNVTPSQMITRRCTNS